MTTPGHDWTASAAKWVAVGILGSASIAGIAWTIATRPQPAQTTPVAVAPGAGEADPDQALEQKPRDFSAQTPQREAPPQPAAPRLINVNLASAADLELLPGIGPTLAARIVADRDTNGSFPTLDDVARVRGIGPRTVDKIRDLAMAR